MEIDCEYAGASKTGNYSHFPTGFSLFNFPFYNGKPSCYNMDINEMHYVI